MSIRDSASIKKAKQPTLKRGGMVVGPFHHEQSGGPKFQLKDTKDIIEEEGFEFNIPEDITSSKKIYTFTGKNVEVIHKILKLAGLSAFDKVTDVKAGDIVICIKSAWDDTVRTYTGTITEILSAVNTSCGCKHIEDGAVVKEIGVDKAASFNPLPEVKKTGGKLSSKEKLNEWMMLNPNSPRWKKKKESITELSNNIHRLKLNLSKDLNSEDEKEFLTALVIAIMIQTAERVGNEDSAKEGHVGVTGFLKKHVTVIGSKVLLEYQGKSGVEHEKSFSNEKIAKAVKKAIKNSPSKYLFETSDGFRIKVDRVNRYLSDFNISAKAIRGYCANKWIIEKLQTVPVQETEKKRKKDFNAVVKKVAHRVGHGPATLRKHYMIPELPIEYISKGKIINIKNMGYYKDGGDTGDIPVEQYFANPNELPEAIKEKTEELEKQAADEDKDIADIFKACPVKTVKWEDIIPTQESLRSGKASKIEKVSDIYSIALPCFFEYNGKFYVNDGHHRAAKMHERGLPIKAHVYEIEEEEYVVSEEENYNTATMKKAGKIKKEGGYAYDDIENISDKIATGEMLSKYKLKFICTYPIRGEAEGEADRLKEFKFDTVILEENHRYYVFVNLDKKNPDWSTKEYKLPKYRMNKEGGTAGLKNGYYIYVTPQNKNFEPHIWIEGGFFTEKKAAQFQAQQMRKMKQDYNRKMPFYEKVEIMPATMADKILLPNAHSEGGTIVDKIVYWTLPKTTPVHSKPDTKIIIEKQNGPVKHAYGSYQLWKIYMESPDGEKYWKQTGLSYEKAMKRGEDLKDTIESGYEIMELTKK